MSHERSDAMGYGCTCHYWTESWDEFNSHLEEHWKEQDDED